MQTTYGYTAGVSNTYTDGFRLILNSTMSTVRAGTYFGGYYYDWINSIVVDPVAGRARVTGTTYET